MAIEFKRYAPAGARSSSLGRQPQVCVPSRQESPFRGDVADECDRRRPYRGFDDFVQSLPGACAPGYTPAPLSGLCQTRRQSNLRGRAQLDFELIRGEYQRVAQP